MLRNADKQKSTISDKLTAETLHSTMEDIEPSEELVKMEGTITSLDRMIEKLNAMSDEFFGTSNDQAQRGSKTSHITFNEEGGNYTNLFNNATLLTDSAQRSSRMHIFFGFIGVIVVVGFALIFYLAHQRDGK